MGVNVFVCQSVSVYGCRFHEGDCVGVCMIVCGILYM